MALFLWDLIILITFKTKIMNKQIEESFNKLMNNESVEQTEKDKMRDIWINLYNAESYDKLFASGEIKRDAKAAGYDTAALATEFESTVGKYSQKYMNSDLRGQNTLQDSIDKLSAKFDKFIELQTQVVDPRFIRQRQKMTEETNKTLAAFNENKNRY